MTTEGERNVSRVEFDNTYFAIDDDIEQLVSTNFGLRDEKLEEFKEYIEDKGELLKKLSQSLFVHLKFANGLFPNCQRELEERRMHQKYASGACYGIATLYERIFHHIGVSQEKHVNEVKHIKKELNSIKSWRESDSKRFKF